MTIPSLVEARSDFETNTIKAVDSYRWSLIPVHCQQALKDWILVAYSPGSFVTAVLENDLMQACGRADHINRHCLFDYVSFLYNDAPASSWGSSDKVKKWSQVGGLLRRREKS